MKKKYLKATVIFFALAIMAFKSLAQNKLDSIRSFIHSEVINRKIPGIQTVIIKDGKIILSEAYGMANIEHNVAVDNQTLFSINSATKSLLVWQ